MSKIKKEIKMRVTPEQSKKIQEICFENNIGWASGKILKHLDSPFLYIRKYNELGYSKKADELFFIRESNEEVSAELFIRTNGTCVESETTTEDTNKGEQMEELKLECLVEGYEGTYFEVGQVWEIKSGDILKVKGFDFETDIYKLTMTEVDDLDEEYYYTSKGEDVEGAESDLDLVKLISTEVPTESTPTENPQPKTLSEYLKENNAYESFVENCVERALLNPEIFEWKRGKAKDIDDFLFWGDTKEGHDYWCNLQCNIPKSIEYDMNEIVFAEVDKRIAECLPKSNQMVSTESRGCMQMKALELLYQYQQADEVAGGYMSKPIDEAIKELEDLQNSIKSSIEEIEYALAKPAYAEVYLNNALRFLNEKQYNMRGSEDEKKIKNI